MVKSAEEAEQLWEKIQKQELKSGEKDQKARDVLRKFIMDIFGKWEGEVFKARHVQIVDFITFTRIVRQYASLYNFLKDDNDQIGIYLQSVLRGFSIVKENSKYPQLPLKNIDAVDQIIGMVFYWKAKEFFSYQQGLSEKLDMGIAASYTFLPALIESDFLPKLKEILQNNKFDKVLAADLIARAKDAAVLWGTPGYHFLGKVCQIIAWHSKKINPKFLGENPEARRAFAKLFMLGEMYLMTACLLAPHSLAEQNSFVDKNILSDFANHEELQPYNKLFLQFAIPNCDWASEILQPQVPWRQAIWKGAIKESCEFLGINDGLTITLDEQKENSRLTDLEFFQKMRNFLDAKLQVSVGTKCSR